MGTEFRIILYTKNHSVAEKASQAAFREIDRLNQSMSDYLETSEVSILSKNAGKGKKVKVSKDLYKVLKKAKKWSRKTNGAFDVSIGPLSKLWRRAFRQQEFPDSSDIMEARAKVNFRWIKLSLFNQKAYLKKPGMRLDLGGIAKGYAVDAAMKVLQNQGIEQALVDGGGDILCSEAPPDSSGWKILAKIGQAGDIQDSVLTISNIAIASSGTSYRYLFWQGKRYSHLIDPRTGYGAINSKIVTIMAKHCTEADILASVVSITGNQILEKKWFNRHGKLVRR